MVCALSTLPAQLRKHERAVADERHAEGAAPLAVARAGVDPLLVEGAVDEAASGGQYAAERVAHEVEAVVPADTRLGANGSGANEVAPRQRVRRSRAARAFAAGSGGSRGASRRRPPAWRRRWAGRRCWRTARRRAGTPSRGGG